MFKQAQQILEAQRRYSLAPDTYWAPQVDTYKGIPVVLDSDCIAAKFGVVDTIGACALIWFKVFDLNGVKSEAKIVVNHAFAQLDKDVKQAFFEHELGHLQLHPSMQDTFSNPTLKDLLFGKGSYLDKEFEADYHAFQIMGDTMIKALQTFLYSELDWASKILIKHRIKRLQQLA